MNSNSFLSNNDNNNDNNLSNDFKLFESDENLENKLINNHHQSNITSIINSHGQKSSPSSPRKFSLNLLNNRPASVTPVSSGSGSGTLTTNAPVFIPAASINHHHHHHTNHLQTTTPAKNLQHIKLNKSAAEFSPSGLPINDPNTIYNNPSSSSDQTTSFSSSSSTTFLHEPQFHSHHTYPYDPDRLHHHQPNHSSINESYLTHDGYISHNQVQAPSLSNFHRPLNYHLYAPPLPHSSNQHPHQLALNSFFMPPSIRETLQKKSAAILQGPTHEVARTPEDLGVYHSLVVLDSPHSNPGSSVLHHPNIPLSTLNGSIITNSINNHNTTTTFAHRSPYRSRILKHPTWIYKAFCSLDGKAYCLYRIEGVQLKQGHGEAAIGQVERWRKIRHPAIVNVREAFTTRAFGDHSILIAYDYHPISQTLYEEHISTKKKSTFSFGSSTSMEIDHLIHRSNSSPGSTRYYRHRPMSANLGRVGLVEERIIWSYLIQISNAIKTVHMANLAVRTIDPTKILLTSANRVRINACGILDVTEYSPISTVEDLQQDDLRDLGSLICSIASCSECLKTDINALSKGVEYIKQFYSRELNEAVGYLLRSVNDCSLPGNAISIDGFLSMIWQHGLDEMTKVFNHNDLLEECLARELENGRIVRLLTKLGFINERPEFDHDPNWSETSERYLLKLFRDYVFHQVDANGKPITDLSHVLTCLNKLDSSLDEKITLISRDDQTCAIVSYAELRRIMDSAFRDLTK
ncbi:hypothetical protein O181_074486 [Austropuccinia psidii MF-1]|uniref:PAN2-PAN3 deadenylation complex subunit PAN3 n=1 Tax=Austropuccinia psidii MF-1 TaxID=1389203 RepID=A0A9Q3FCY9_9BASI|nr:hypothetical protein [Austropuccinia psidii MF-1]